MSTMRTVPVLFREQQRFTQVWLWLVMAAISGVYIWGFVQQVLFKRPWGDNPTSDLSLAVLVLVMAGGLPLFMYSCRLVTEVCADALYVRFIPFHLHRVRIDYATITACQAVKYNPLLDYGGWGLRYGRNGTAYNISGNLGVRLEFVSGQPLLIGTRQPLELAAAIQQAMGAGRADL
jgi:hypothetical protein